MSASSPATLRSASPYEAPGISVIAIISRRPAERQQAAALPRFQPPFRDRRVHRRLDHLIAPMPLQLAQAHQVRQPPSAGTVPSGAPRPGPSPRRKNTRHWPADGALPATVTVPPLNRRPEARTTTVPAGVPVTGNSAVRLASITQGR